MIRYQRTILLIDIRIEITVNSISKSVLLNNDVCYIVGDLIVIANFQAYGRNQLWFLPQKCKINLSNEFRVIYIQLQSSWGTIKYFFEETHQQVWHCTDSFGVVWVLLAQYTKWNLEIVSRILHISHIEQCWVYLMFLTYRVYRSFGILYVLK